MNATTIKKILILDDDENILELFSLNLQKLGFQTNTVTDAEIAIDQCQQSVDTDELFDVIIIDLNIPGSMSGTEFAKKIRSLAPQIKLIVSSGDSSAPEMLQCAEYGFDAALEKAFNRENIKAVIEQVLDSPDSENTA